LINEERILPSLQNYQVVLLTCLEAVFCGFDKNPKMPSTFSTVRVGLWSVSLNFNSRLIKYLDIYIVY
jgi:hypothetical protein